MAPGAPEGKRRGAGRGGEGVAIEVPAGVPWPIHRVATSGHYRDPLHTIVTQWSLADVMQANAVIDAIEAAVRKARESDGG